MKADALEGVYHGMTLPNEEDVPDGAPGCQRCEVLPLPIRGPGTLELRQPHTYSLGKTLEFLTQSRWEHREREGTVTVRVPGGSLAPLLAPIMDRLSPTEQRDTRAHFLPDGALPQEGDRFEIEALPDFAAKSRSDWLLDILRGGRLYSVFQPIVSCADPSDVHGHECLMQAEVESGAVSPGLMLDLAAGAGLLFQLDLAARRSAVVSAAAHALPARVFINFTPNAIYSPHSCLNSTVRMVDELGMRRDQVVFEIIESERLPETAHMKRIVGYYREQGFGVALDDVGAGYSSLSPLLELRPDYVKIDRALIECVDREPDKALVARKLLETAQELDIQTIAEGIERREEWEWVRAHGADFVQGYLFARPAARARLALSQGTAQRADVARRSFSAATTSPPKSAPGAGAAGRAATGGWHPPSSASTSPCLAWPTTSAACRPTTCGAFRRSARAGATGRSDGAEVWPGYCSRSTPWARRSRDEEPTSMA